MKFLSQRSLVRWFVVLGTGAGGVASARFAAEEFSRDCVHTGGRGALFLRADGDDKHPAMRRLVRAKTRGRGGGWPRTAEARRECDSARARKFRPAHLSTRQGTQRMDGIASFRVLATQRRRGV